MPNGLKHIVWGPEANVGGTNPTGSHNPGNFGSNQGIMTGCGGPTCSPQSAAGNPGYQYQSGGGYGFSPTQSIVGNYVGGVDKYSSIGINNHGMLNSSTQYNPSDYPLSSIPSLMKGGRRKSNHGGASGYYYGYNSGGNANGMSVFSGSGYPEISKGEQCGGRRKSRKNIKSRRHITRKNKTFMCMNCRMRFNSNKKLKKHLQNCRQSTSSKNRMRSDLFKKLRGGKKTNKKTTKKRQRGGYSQFLSNQPFSLSYSTGGMLGSSESALANPVPFNPMNTCTDPHRMV